MARHPFSPAGQCHAADHIRSWRLNVGPFSPGVCARVTPQIPCTPVWQTSPHQLTLVLLFLQDFPSPGWWLHSLGRLMAAILRTTFLLTLALCVWGTNPTFSISLSVSEICPLFSNPTAGASAQTLLNSCWKPLNRTLFSLQMTFSLNYRFQNTGLCDGHNAAYPYAIQTVSLAPGHTLNNLLDNVAVRSPEDGPILAVVYPPLLLLYPQYASRCLNGLCLPSLFALAYSVLCAWSTLSLISTHLKELLLTRLSSSATTSRTPCWMAIPLAIWLPG